MKKAQEMIFCNGFSVEPTTAKFIVKVDIDFSVFDSLQEAKNYINEEIDTDDCYDVVVYEVKKTYDAKREILLIER